MSRPQRPSPPGGVPADALCPACGSGTGIEREVGPLALGTLQPHEFEILVRNEWRRRLGSAAYGRAHDIRVVRTLALIGAAREGGSGKRRFAAEVSRLVSDLVAEGREREAVRHEVHELLRASRIVLERAGADQASVRAFMARALGAVRVALGGAAP